VRVIDPPSGRPDDQIPDMLDLTGKVALVTGASRGIGRAIACRLATQGATVVAAAREDHADATALLIRERGLRAEAVSLDVTDSPAVERLPAEIVRRHGRLDIIVSNAGIARDQLLMRIKREDWDAVLATNLTATFVLTQAAIRQMLKQRTGRIIAISSVVGQTGNAGQSNYAASKAGLIGFTKALAREVASRSITVNVVAPGLVDTEMTHAIAEKSRSEWAAQIPIGRPGTPDEVAAAVCFLASDEAAYITGHVLAVNGGMYM
jgi:3-oxoacyl-[acyl-carrier protein] reductase